MLTLCSKVQLSARRLQFSEKASYSTYLYRQITRVYCNTNVSEIEVDVLECLKLHTHTWHLVHNLGET